MTLSFAPERIEQWPLERLKPYARNAKTHGADQVTKIAASMAKFGWTNPVLVGGDGEVIAGHGRILAAAELGLTEAPVIVIDHLTEEERQAYRISDNKLTELGAWDEALLAAELQALAADDFDLSLTGFSDAELDQLLAFDVGGGEVGDRGVRTRTVVIESRDGTLSLIPFSERGSAYDQQVPERRDVRAFVCRQFKKQDVIWASEIQSVRDFGSESAFQQVQTEVARRLGSLRRDAEATFEYHLLNGIQGVVKDPKDGATVVNYFTEFAITPATEVDFDLDNASPASGALRKRCQALIEDVEASMGGLATGAVQLRAECGSTFFADLVAHKEVRETYLNTAAAADLRSRVSDEVSFGGISFRRYRGNAAFGVPADKAFFYPEGVEGLFEIYYAPADTFETVNKLGLPLYARAIPDRERDEWVRLEIESNPLPICTRPQVLRSARRT